MPDKCISGTGWSNRGAGLIHIENLTGQTPNGNSTRAYVTRLLSGQASVIVITITTGNRVVLSGADF